MRAIVETAALVGSAQTVQEVRARTNGAGPGEPVTETAPGIKTLPAQLGILAGGGRASTEARHTP